MVPKVTQGALHSATWVPVVAAHLRETGHDADAALKQSGFENGMPDGADAKVPFAQVATFFEKAAEICDDDLLCFKMAQQVDPREAGLIAYVGFNAPTLRDFVRNIEAYARVFSDAIRWDLSEFETKGRLSWAFSAPPSVARRQCVEWSSALYVSTLRKVTKAPLWCEGVSFIHPRNANIEDIERFFGCRVAFGRRSNTILLKLADLDLPVVDADQRLLRLLKKLADETLRKMEANRPELQEQVEKAILARLSSGNVSADVIAEDLGMSVRTLARRLAEIEMPYSAVLSNLREALATRFLQHSELAITQIAYLLGYADSSAFSTAYRNWTGRTPREVRQAAPH